DFLGSAHTRKHYKEDWYPALFDRHNYEAWEKAGAKTLRQRAREKALDILENHKPEPLPESVVKKLNQIIEEAKVA
ncbi:MAG: trimethylamine methyltransferase family protein, partial [Anaerolineales bacterium]